ncbi:hypothetical protein Bhyg_03204 [Pseudolycoriella hygida]|uniref:Uncharacterized protein n=1 Tax=Pseudolycoriella hygida TaxID=35572 RepID=A0A9Q0S7B2_9DIPT|nr:hypothetical protein Bhyg_03204 [Pseudolycoriella hygida]
MNSNCFWILGLKYAKHNPNNSVNDSTLGILYRNRTKLENEFKLFLDIGAKICQA